MSTLAKPRPKLLDKRKAKADLAKIDRDENAKVKARSGGRCEVLVVLTDVRSGGLGRCPLRASHVHHLISGIGRRNRGVSIEAAHKLHVCERCHAEIHGHVLKPVNDYEREAAATVKYERIK
jgi:hypothetical protein